VDSLTFGTVQPFSQKSHTPTVAKEFQIGHYDPTEADLEHFWNSCGEGFLGERLYEISRGLLCRTGPVGSGPSDGLTAAPLSRLPVPACAPAIRGHCQADGRAVVPVTALSVANRRSPLVPGSPVSRISYPILVPCARSHMLGRFAAPPIALGWLCASPSSLPFPLPLFPTST